MTRGRRANHAYGYEHSTEASEFGHEQPAGTHFAQRGDNSEAAALIHGILTRDEPAVTAHDYAARRVDEALPARVRDLLNMRAAATEHRHGGFKAWKTERRERERKVAEDQERHIDRGRHRSTDYGLEL